TALDRSIKDTVPEKAATANPDVRKRPKGLSAAEKKIAREAALERAGYKCQQCGLPNHAIGYRTDKGEFVVCKGDDLKNYAGKGLSWPTGEPLTKAEAREITALLNN